MNDSCPFKCSVMSYILDTQFTPVLIDESIIVQVPPKSNEIMKNKSSPQPSPFIPAPGSLHEPESCGKYRSKVVKVL